MESKVEGLLLHALPYLGNAYILKVFTKELGLISLIAKGVKKKNWSLFTSPFCIADWVVRKGKEELYLLLDASLIDSLSCLKGDFSVLSAASSIAKDLLVSQMPSKNSEPLYLLSLIYMKRLSRFTHPEILSLSFKMKLLKWEGLLTVQETCSECSHFAEALSMGESFCKQHAPSGFSLYFDLEEWKVLNRLSLSKRFHLMEEIVPKEALKRKVEILFRERLS